MEDSRESVLTVFFEICRKQPKHIAVQDGQRAMTYEDLEASSYTVAAKLTQLGITRGDVIPVVTQSSLDMIIGVLGVLRSGATYVPLDRSQWPMDKIRKTISRLQARIAIYTGNDVDLGSCVFALSVERAMERPRKVAKRVSRACIPNIRPGDLACIIFTSGTTGEPKGVMIQHSSLHHFVTSPPFNYNVTPLDRVLLVLSCAFDACMGTLFSVLCNGGCVVIADGSNFQERVRRCTVFVGTPSILEALEPPKSPIDYELMDRLILGGETPTAALLKRWTIINRPIWIAYGPTEATCATLTGKITVSVSNEPSDPRFLGSPIDGATVAIVDDEMRPITALDEEGELLISGPGLARGYWRDDRQTNEKFVLLDGKRTYRTGDYARWIKDEQGSRTVYFCGRKDRVVKLRGFLVNLDTEVDAAILKHAPELKGVYSFLDHKHLYTAVRPMKTDEPRLLCQLRHILPQYMVPEQVVSMDCFPKNSYGKTDLRQLQSLVSQKLHSDATKSCDFLNSSLLETHLFGGLHEVLGVSKNHVNPTLSFIGNGVYSLTAVRLSLLLRKRGFCFRPQDFLSSITIDEFLRTNQALKPAIVDRDEQRPPSLETAPAISPLTPQQLRLVHGTLRHPHFNIVNHILECDYQHLSRLKEAWGLVVHVEPIFRTSIEACEGEYIQRLRGHSDVLWYEADIYLEQLEEQLVMTAAHTRLGHRFTVFKFQDMPKAALIWSVHHALADGFSAAIVLEKLAKVLRGEEIKPSMPFPAVAHSLRTSIEQRQAASRKFWEGQDSRFPQASGDLPIPEPETSHLVLTHREHDVSFDHSTVEAIAAFCTSESVTPAAIHYAVWSLVLSTYTGSAKVIFGSVFSGRDQSDYWSDSLIGCLLDTLAFRNLVDREIMASDFVRHTHQQILSVSQFNGSSEPGSQASYSTAISCDPEIPEWDAASMGFRTSSRVAQYPDLPLLVLVRKDERVSLVYKTEKYHEKDVLSLGALYKSIMIALLDPQLSIREVLQQKFSSENENRILALGNFNRDETYTNTIPTTISRMFDDATTLYPSLVAIEKGDQQVTYAQMKQRVEHLASMIQTYVQPGGTVCVLADRSINWIIALFAVLKIAAVYCPVDVGHAANHQEKIIRLSKATLVLCDQAKQLESLPRNGPPALCISTILESMRPGACKMVVRETKATDVAFLVFTSGSTGEPKGILIENRSLVAVQGSYRALFKSAYGRRIAQFLSPGFDVAMQETIWSLCSGATLVLRKDDDNPFSHISNVDTIMVTPSVAANLDPAEYPNLRCIHLAGEPVPDRVVRLWDTPGREVHNIYGPAEATIVTCSQRLKSGEPVCIGPPLPSMRVYILNDHLELLPPGVIGNIYAAGIQVSRGYINNESKTNAAFLLDPFAQSREAQERMYCTGDMGYMDREGRVHYCGRKDRQIKLRGYRTNLDDVADKARKMMPAVQKAFVTERAGRLILWVEPEDIDTVKLRDFLSTAVPAHALPSHVVALERLPLNPNGKIDSQTLKDKSLPSNRGDTASGIGQLSPDEQLIAEVWRSLLSLDSTAIISASDNFIAMGGHSVLQLALTARLKQKFKAPVTVRDVISAPTLGRLASIIADYGRRDCCVADTSQNGMALGREQLSPPELDWWSRYRSAEQISAFNVPFVAQLTPDVDLNKLKASVELAISRHHVLRSRFATCSDVDDPQRVILDDPILVRMAGEDFNLEDFLDQPFDITHDCLVRVVLSPLLIAFSISHMLMDLTALQSLLSDAAMLYNEHSTIELPPPRQYFDVQQWTTPVEPANVSFWRSYLDGTISHRAAPEQRRSYRGTSLFADVPIETYQRLLARTAEEGISLHQFALSATGLVLQVLGGCNSIVLGSPFINRALEIDQKVVGLFLEPLPIKIAWTEDDQMSSRTLLQATKMSSQSALAHAVPWPTLLQTLGLSFPSPRQEAFNTVVTLHDDRHGRPQLPIPGVTAMQRVCSQGAKFALCFEFQALAEGLTVRLEYDTDIMSEGHAKVLQEMLLDASKGLLEPERTYVDIIGSVEGVLRSEGIRYGTGVEEMKRIARENLV